MAKRETVKRILSPLFAVVFLATALTSCACASGTAPTSPPPPTPMPLPATGTPEPTAISERTEAQVVRVVDGDTIKVSIDGQVYTVRYIGIDTPETVDPAKPVQWMGPEASAANRALVEAKTVYLEKDVSETDRYGRLLRYVYLPDGTFVNAELVRLGYAHASTYPPDVKYQDLFRQMEQEAREAGVGLWGPTPTVAAVEAEPTSGTAEATKAPEELPSSAAAKVIIVTVDKQAEYVDIQNVGGRPQSLAGWVLVSEKGDQRCPLSGMLSAGETLRIWAMAKDVDEGGFNCGFEGTIWNNSEPDPAVLYDELGQEVGRK
jgi:micrococcal nuclease